ncbi:hypothetical protein TWF481_010410 [Arthrobotrys musiformis]|uniref:Uncharacterized protein n=1 Tax=Arthrobotrys musiformis TaxID=47236 RepID=A0AAV9W2P9_9PEZI
MPPNSRFPELLTNREGQTCILRPIAPAPIHHTPHPKTIQQQLESHINDRDEDYSSALGFTRASGGRSALPSLYNSEDVICLQVELAHQMENGQALQDQCLQMEETAKQTDMLNKSLIHEVQQCHGQIQSLSLQVRRLASLNGNQSDEIAALRSQIMNEAWREYRNTETFQRRQLSFSAYRLKLTEVEKLRKKVKEQDNQLFKASAHLEELSREQKSLKCQNRQAMEQIESLQWHEKILLDHIKLLEGGGAVSQPQPEQDVCDVGKLVSDLQSGTVLDQTDSRDRGFGFSSIAIEANSAITLQDQGDA